MILDYHNHIFIARCKYGEKDLAKGAGFRWDPNEYVWWTKFPTNAVNLYNYATPAAKAQLDKLIKTREESAATTTDFYAPEPKGLKLYPFQRAGIEFMMKRDSVLLADAMGCISGDAEIIVNRGGNGRRYQIRDVFERFNGLHHNKGFNWETTIPSMTASLMDGELRLNKIKAVVFKGYKDVVEIRTKGGKSLKLTEDHELLLPDFTWAPAGGLSIGDKIMVNGELHCKMCGSTENVATYKYGSYPGYCKKCIYRKLRVNPNYKDGKLVDRDGYVRVSGHLDHPRCSTGGVYEHVLVMEHHLGRFLEWSRENVHHKNGVKDDNRLENLELVSTSEHHKAHKKHNNFGYFRPKEDEIAEIIRDEEVVDVYDISMESPGHSFVVNGIIVHNCGKTSQVIGVINLTESIKSVLVICPASLKITWRNELTKWLMRPLSVGIADSKYFPGTEIVLINYDILKKWYARLRNQTWDLRVCDEVQLLKNSSTIRSQHTLGKWNRTTGKWDIEPIPCKKRIMMTGTPIVNRPVELWPIIRALDPHTWQSYIYFTKRYCGAYRGRWGLDVKGGTNLEELGNILRSTIMIRRLKEEVLTELPPKTRQVIEFDLPDKLRPIIVEERRVFEARLKLIEELQDKASAALVAKDDMAYKLAVGQLKEAQQIAFSDLSRIRHETAVAKLPTVISYLRDIVENEQKVVVFAHHADVIETINQAFPGSVTLTGKTPLKVRQENVDKFQNDINCKMFIGNIQAAGVGITLTASSLVVFAELDWVPGNVSQCEDRCYRIGTVNPVLVQHLVYEESIDAKMAKMIVEKQRVIDKVVNRVQNIPESTVIQEKVQPIAKSMNEGLTQTQLKVIMEGLRILASRCDGAHRVDNHGFNKYDSNFGKQLALQASLSQKQALAARKMLLKYHRQLPTGILEEAWRE